MLKALRAAVVAALALALPSVVLAQTVCRENVIRIIVPFPPGGPTDVAALAAVPTCATGLRNVLMPSTSHSTPSPGRP